MHDEDLLRRSFELAIEYLEGLDHRPVGCPVGLAEMLERMGGPLPQQGSGAIQVIEALSAAADRGIVATAGPRYFGFVTGGAHPASVAADWLTSVWDQNAFSYVLSPAAAAAEEVVRLWLTDLFGLSSEMSMGIVTGGTMANFTALAAARHALLKRVGWNVEEDGLFNAPEITVITSDESHITIFAALQMLGLGRNRVQRVATDNQGRMRTDALKEVLAKLETPVLVCAQAGNVNTGAFDPISEIASLVQERNAWLHVDGAFGLWVAASPEYRHLVQGIERANSITVDCHKWLNVPYDSGLVFVNDHSAHQQAMTFNAPYYMPGQIVARENYNYVPEASRRARGFPIYAVMRALGREGLAELIERCCHLAQRMADQLSKAPGVEILNEVVINQVLVRFSPLDGGNGDAFTAKVIRQIQEEGTCWAGGTLWHGMNAMRISISNWSTTETDIDLSAKAILKCAENLQSSL